MSKVSLPIALLVMCGSFFGCDQLGDVTGPDGSTNVEAEFGVTNSLEQGVVIDIVFVSDVLVKDLAFGKTAPIRISTSVPNTTYNFVAKGYRHLSDGTTQFLGCDQYTVTTHSYGTTDLKPWGVSSLALNRCGN